MPQPFITFQAPELCPVLIGTEGHSSCSSMANLSLCERSVPDPTALCLRSALRIQPERATMSPERQFSINPDSSAHYSFLWLMKELQLHRYFDKSATLYTVHLDL